MYVSKCFKSNNLFNSNYLSIKLFLLYKLLKITVSVFTFLALLGARLGAGVVNYVNILIPNTWRYLTCFSPLTVRFSSHPGTNLHSLLKM